MSTAVKKSDSHLFLKRHSILPSPAVEAIALCSPFYKTNSPLKENMQFFLRLVTTSVVVAVKADTELG